jgi:hypothetical protein
MVCVCVCCASIFTLPGIRQRGAPQRAQVDLFLLELWCSEQVDQALFTALSAGVNHSGHFPFYWAFFRLLLYYSRFISLCDHVILFLLSPFSFLSFLSFLFFLSFFLNNLIFYCSEFNLYSFTYKHDRLFYIYFDLSTFSKSFRSITFIWIQSPDEIRDS